MMGRETLMKPASLTLILLFGVIASAPGCGKYSGSSAEARVGSGVAFSKLGFEEALGKARSTNSLLMVDVYTDWCGWCKKLDHDVFEDDQVGAALKGFVAIRFDAENGGERILEKFKVNGFPTVLFLDPDGGIVKRVNGYVNRDTMLQVIAALPRKRA